LLEAIARKRGAVMSGGRVNTQKAAELVITDFTHILGRITLETPAEFAQWVAAGEAAEQQRQALAEAKKKQRKAARR
jgi:ribosome biogenesis GTPase A